MRLYITFFLTIFLSLQAEKWSAYYTDELPPSAFFSYDLLVFDSHTKPNLEPLKERQITLLGYLSLGEVESFRPYFSTIKKQGILLEKNPNWNSYRVDLREKFYTKMVIEQLVPEILDQGFDGLFLDTLDSAEGMDQEAIILVKAIRHHYPHIKIMVNRAFPLLPHIANEIDFVLAESIFTTYNFKKKTYEKVPKKTYESIAKELNQYPLKIYTLDYWPTEDKATISEIYRIQREHNFIPYVSTIKLNLLHEEP